MRCGGLLLLPNKDLYTRGKLLRWYGIDRDKRNYQVGSTVQLEPGWCSLNLGRPRGLTSLAFSS